LTVLRWFGKIYNQGDLYSVKIMWPRTAEERARNRNTGFVCFMIRDDAQEAMDAFNDADPLECGRRMVLRWGKNVKKTVRRGVGGVPIPVIRKCVKNKGEIIRKTPKVANQEHHHYDENTHVKDFPEPDEAEIQPEQASTTQISLPIRELIKAQLVSSLAIPPFNPVTDTANAEHVKSPETPHRLRFISTVASFVAKDGSIFERKLALNEANNPLFSFLKADPKDGETIFYRWRVYSFCQGDGFDSWRTDPFKMLHPTGKWWIPPELDSKKARREEDEKKRKEDDLRKKMEDRKKLAEKKDFMTGRQLEHAKFTNLEGGGAKLNDYEMERFRILFKQKLCADRKSICDAMAFCFDKSGAATQIADLLKEGLLETGDEISVDTRIARLYLLSDVLFNSQQPGVRNAFRYRDAIQAMAPDVFQTTGKHGQGKAGRMTMNKLRVAIRGVLNAWTNWSVYNSAFIDELEARFEGKEIPKPKTVAEPATEPRGELDDKEKNAMQEVKPCFKPRGGWTDAELIPSTLPEPNEENTQNQIVNAKVEERTIPDSTSTHPERDGNFDGEPFDDSSDETPPQEPREIDGEELVDDDFDGEPFTENDFDGELLEIHDANVQERSQNPESDAEKRLKIIPTCEGQNQDEIKGCRNGDVDTHDAHHVDGEELADGDTLNVDYVDGEELVDGDEIQGHWS